MPADVSTVSYQQEAINDDAVFGFIITKYFHTSKPRLFILVIALLHHHFRFTASIRFQLETRSTQKGEVLSTIKKVSHQNGWFILP